MVCWLSWCFLCLSFVIVVVAITVFDVIGVVVVGGGVIVVIVGVIVVATVVFVGGGVGDLSDFIDLYEMKFISTTEI